MRIEPTKHGDLLYKTDNTTGLFIILSANVGILVHKNGDANQQERTFQPIDGNNYSFHARFPWDSLWAILIFNGTWHLASVPPYIWDVRMYTRGPARFEIWGKNWRLQTWVSVHIALGKGRSVCCMGPRILLVDLIWLLTPIFSVDFRQNQPGKGQIYRSFFFRFDPYPHSFLRTFPWNRSRLLKNPVNRCFFYRIRQVLDSGDSDFWGRPGRLTDHV